MSQDKEREALSDDAIWELAKQKCGLLFTDVLHMNKAQMAATVRAALATQPPAVQAAQSAGEVERKARPIYELPSVERDEAIRAFEAAHGVHFAADLPSDRAWVEGYAHACATLSHKELKS